MALTRNPGKQNWQTLLQTYWTLEFTERKIPHTWGYTVTYSVTQNLWKSPQTRESSCPVQFQEGVEQWYIIWGKFPKINPQGLILGGAKYGGFLLALICFSGLFFEDGGYFWNLSKLFLFVFLIHVVMFSPHQNIFLKKSFRMLLYKYNFNIAIMQHNLLASDRIKLTTIREILGLMASRQVEKAPSDGISPAEEKLEFDDATLRGNQRYF